MWLLAPLGEFRDSLLGVQQVGTGQGTNEGWSWRTLWAKGPGGDGQGVGWESRKWGEQTSTKKVEWGR